MTDRGRVADEVVILQADIAMQSHQVEPLVVENRRDRDSDSVLSNQKPHGTRSPASAMVRTGMLISVIRTRTSCAFCTTTDLSRSIWPTELTTIRPAPSLIAAQQVRIAQRIGAQRHPRQTNTGRDRHGEFLTGMHINRNAVLRHPLRNRAVPESCSRKRDLGHREELAVGLAPP